MKNNYIEGLVSVIMPAYNCEKYIKEAVESIENQTYKKVELINLKRKRKDEYKKGFLGLISLTDYEDDYKEEEHIKSFNNLISKTIVSSLRKGDIYTFWNDTQVLVLIEGVKEDGEKIIQDRIQRRFRMINKYPITIDIKFIQIEDKEDAEIFK